MPTYVTLWEYTDEGAQHVRESPERIEELESEFESLGGTLRDFYLLMGRFDTLTISEFPDDETATQAILSVVEKGNASGETLKAYSLEEFAELVEGMP